MHSSRQAVRPGASQRSRANGNRNMAPAGKVAAQVGISTRCICVCRAVHAPTHHTCMQAAATELVVPSKDLVIPKYCESIHQTRRRPTRTVTVGTETPRGRHRPNSRHLTHPPMPADWPCEGWQRAPHRPADHDHHRHPQCGSHSGAGGPGSCGRP